MPTDHEAPPEIIDSPEIQALYEEWRSYDAHREATLRQLQTLRLEQASFNVGDIVEVYYSYRYGEPKRWRTAKVFGRRAFADRVVYTVLVQISSKKWGQRTKQIVDQFVRAKKEGNQ